jgi:hypothetical protein
MREEGKKKRKGDTLPVCSSPLASSRTDARAENRKSNKSDLFLLPSCVCWLANDEGGQARPGQAGRNHSGYAAMVMPFKPPPISSKIFQGQPGESQKIT